MSPDAIAIVARTNGATKAIGSLIGHRKSGDWSRVVVVGANGAGKTWFSNALSAKVGLRVIHKDALALRERWHQRPREEVQAALKSAIAADCWILEGGPSILSPDVLARATKVIWLDLPAPLRAWRILCRSIKYFGRVRPEHPPGNRDWPGPRQFGFIWRAMVGGAGSVATIERALAGWDGAVVRLHYQADVSALIEAAGEGAETF